MEFKNLSFYFPFALFLLFSTFPLSFSSSSSSSSSKQNGGVKKSHRQSSSLPNSIIQSSFSTSFDFKFSGQAGPIDVKNSDHRNGKWILLQKSIGVSAMHMQLLHNNKVVIFDRTDFGASNLSLPQGQCRYSYRIISKSLVGISIYTLFSSKLLFSNLYFLFNIVTCFKLEIEVKMLV